MKHFEANNPFKFKVTNFEITDWQIVDLEKNLNFLSQESEVDLSNKK